MTEKIVDRIKKLLSLAQSANVNEAANAAAAAQKLMAEHGIAQAMLETAPDAPSAPREAVGQEHFATTGERKLVRWLARLASVVAAANGCRIFLTGPVLHIVGTPSDAATARYLYTYLRAEIDRLAKAAIVTREATWESGKTWGANFRLGAVEEIGRRLREANEEARKAAREQAAASDTLGNGAALVRVNNALARIDEKRADVARYYGSLRLGKGRAWTMRGSSEAREAGRRAGASINLSSGKPLGSGSRGNLRA